MIRENILKKNIQSLYSPINIYLRFHGIGFTKKMCFEKENRLSTIFSFLILILFEGYYAYGWYIVIQNSLIYKFVIDKAYVAAVIGNFLNFTVRLQFYTRRKEFKDILEKLSLIYAKIGDEIKYGKVLKLKLIIVLLMSDFSVIGSSLHKFLQFCPQFSEEFSYGFVEYLSEVSIYCISSFIDYLLVFGGVTSYFYLVCIILERILKEFKDKLQKKAELDCLVIVHREIFTIISKINSVLHFSLLATVASMLIITFRESFIVLFATDYLDFFVYVNMTSSFLMFVLICMSSSLVIEAASEVKSIGEYSEFDATNVKHLQFFHQVNEGFPGFKILNSIVIDSSLIFTSVGMLLTYGILIATFSVNKN